MAYTPNYPTSGSGTTAQLRAELDAIAAELDNLLDRTDINNNAMTVDLDMNGNSILNGSASLTELTSFATVELVNQIVAGTVAQFLVPIISLANSYTPLANTENNSTYVMTSGAATTFTIPHSSTVSFPVGSVLTIIRNGVGELQILPAASVTLNSELGADKLNVQYSAATLLSVGVDSWVLTGSIKV